MWNPWPWHGCWCWMSWFEYSETADLLGFSGIKILHTMVQKPHQLPVSSHSVWQKSYVHKRDQKRMARLVQANRKTIVTQINTLYNCGEQKRVESWGGWAQTAEMHIGFLPHRNLLDWAVEDVKMSRQHHHLMILDIL